MRNSYCKSLNTSLSAVCIICQNTPNVLLRPYRTMLFRKMSGLTTLVALFLAAFSTAKPPVDRVEAVHRRPAGVNQHTSGDSTILNVRHFPFSFNVLVLDDRLYLLQSSTTSPPQRALLQSHPHIINWPSLPSMSSSRATQTSLTGYLLTTSTVLYLPPMP